VGAPQNRLFELALRLQHQGLKITVLTAMPNYPQYEIYEAYKGKRYVKENMSGLEVHRSSIFVSKNKSIINRLRNYFSFVFSSAWMGYCRLDNFDFLLCESPPLFLGYSALFLAKRKKAKLIFNVSDLWPESAEKLGVVTNSFLLRMAYNLEAKLYKRSVLVTGQTQGICKNIKARFPNVKTHWLPNGVDLNYYNQETVVATNWRVENGFSENDILFLYAGIIGIAQGLEVILKAAELLKHKTTFKFILLGSGPEKEKLLELKHNLQLENVFFMEAVTKKEMPFVLKSVDACVVPLRKLELFLGAIPSKLFEAFSMELPVILGVDGEARELFVTQGKCSLYFEPENETALADCIEQCGSNEELRKKLGKNARLFVQQHFNRDNIAKKMHEQIQSLT
jgi:glycosyltransferase involved in cell wall biosynthesis